MIHTVQNRKVFRMFLSSYLAYSGYYWMRQVMYKLSSYDLITIHSTYHYNTVQLEIVKQVMCTSRYGL